MAGREATLPRGAPVAGGGFLGRLDALARRVETGEPERPATGALAVVVALLGLGLLVQASHAATTLPPAGFRAALLEGLVHRTAAVVALLVAFRLGPYRLRRLVPHLTAAVAILLVAVYVPGLDRAANGSRRWIELPLVGVSLQPSELARVVLVLWVADRCARLGPRLRELRGFLPMLLMGLALFGLVALQPDLGGALLLLICFVSTMWVGGARPAHVFGSLGLAGGGALALAFSTLAYVRERLAVWMGESGNEQVRRTVEAMASGDWLGVGLAQGAFRGRGLQYMQTDYVFALVGEELGLLGLALVVGLFLAFAWYSLRLVLSLRERFGALVAFGLTTSVVLQAMLHLQVACGLAPPKGIGLPFLSAGGTSLLASSLAVGLALGAVRGPATDPTPP